jgi:two-component sensor histidine kinase
MVNSEGSRGGRSPLDSRLRELHDISMELSRAEDSDALCRRAVELCTARLGFDRIGIWFLDSADPGMMNGCWGTDEAGVPRDERGIRIRRDAKYHPREIYDGSVPFALLPGEEVYDEKGGPVGRSDKIIAPLWDGAEVVGEIVADNVLSHRPLDEEDGEILVLFARTVAHLSALKRSGAALQEALAAKALLLNELRHRTLNGFALVTSLVALEANKAEDPAMGAALRRIRDRVAVLVALYRKLDLSSDSGEVELGDYLRKIAADLLDGADAARRGISLAASLDEARMDMKRAVTLGLVVNELVTDSLKHAFPEGRRGTVSLSLRRGSEDYVLTVSDDGIGLPSEPPERGSKGIGLSLVRMLCAQLGARLEVLPPRSAFVISVPSGPRDRGRGDAP